MHRLLIAAATLAFIGATVSPALADEYPPCSRTVTDKCRVVPATHHVRGHHPVVHHSRKHPKGH